MCHLQSWYHGGLLLQVHASVLVGAAALADIIAQVGINLQSERGIRILPLVSNCR